MYANDEVIPVKSGGCGWDCNHGGGDCSGSIVTWHSCCTGGRGGMGCSSCGNSGDGAAASTIIVMVEWN